MSRRAGRISFVLLAGIVAAIFVGILLLSSGQSPTSAASDFMDALARGDAKRLAELSIYKDRTQGEIQKEWEKTLSYSRHYLFVWRLGQVSQSGDNAEIRVQVVPNAARRDSYDQNFGLALQKVDGKWKVDVGQINREMFPNLPQ